MKKEINYYVIGGQYASYNYGGTRTLLGAKRLAGKHKEYWDNWAGWHKPMIYKADDCELRKNFYGKDYYPKWNSSPVAFWDEFTGKWESDASILWCR